MATTRATFTLERELAARARELRVNVSAAAREGVSTAVRRAAADADRGAYERSPEVPDDFWEEAEAWIGESAVGMSGGAHRFSATASSGAHADGSV